MLTVTKQCVSQRTSLRYSRAVWRVNISSTYAFASSSRSYATIANQCDILNPGEHLHGFTLKRTKHIPELQLTAFHLKHERTGAEHLHIARDDKNNVFSVGFKTNPPDSTGVPHILEHTTLCGSKK